jgi:hypothetical protein
MARKFFREIFQRPISSLGLCAVSIRVYNGPIPTYKIRVSLWRYSHLQTFPTASGLSSIELLGLEEALSWLPKPR